MIRLSGARCLAMSVVGTLVGWWVSVDDLSTITHYRGLSHAALLTELAQKNDGRVTTSIMGGLIVVISVVVLVDVLTRFFDAVWRRIEPPTAQGSTLPAPTKDRRLSQVVCS
jgi:hypothetical protein